MIFNHVLYQLSYLATSEVRSGALRLRGGEYGLRPALPSTRKRPYRELAYRERGAGNCREARAAATSRPIWARSSAREPKRCSSRRRWTNSSSSVRP